MQTYDKYDMDMRSFRKSGYIFLMTTEKNKRIFRVDISSIHPLEIEKYMNSNNIKINSLRGDIEGKFKVVFFAYVNDPSSYYHLITLGKKIQSYLHLEKIKPTDYYCWIEGNVREAFCMCINHKCHDNANSKTSNSIENRFYYDADEIDTEECKRILYLNLSKEKSLISGCNPDFVGIILLLIGWPFFILLFVLKYTFFLKNTLEDARAKKEYTELLGEEIQQIQSGRYIKIER